MCKYILKIFYQSVFKTKYLICTCIWCLDARVIGV